MAEYIEREAAIEACCGGCNPAMCSCDCDEVAAIRAIPFADVQPVRHGRWVSVPHKRERICSWCEQDEPYKFADENANVFDFCPHCGTLMDGGDSI